MADDVRSRLDAAQFLVSARRFEEAADAFLAILPPRPTRVEDLDADRRKAALHAGICFARAGRARMAVGLFVALGEKERAAAVLKSAGRRSDGARVMKGQPAPDSPWPPGILHSRPGQREAEGTTGSVQGDPFALADRLARTDRPREALDALLAVAQSHRRYPEAVARVVRLARQHGLMSYGLERFVEPFVRQQGVRHTPTHLSTLYSLGILFQTAGMEDSASRAFRAVVAIDPAYRDAGSRVAALMSSQPGADGDFARVLEEDVAFSRVDGEHRHPGQVSPRSKLLSLPSLPDLPPIDAPAPLPPRSTPGTSAPQPPPQPLDVEEHGPESASTATDWGAVEDTISEARLAAAPNPLRARTRSEELGLGPVQQGDVIANRYRVDSELGAGGMAVVYRVTDLELEEEVALKLFARSPEDATAVARFKQEMRIARKLSHPNIVRSYEFGTWRRAYFLTMEVLEGHDLAALLKKRGGKLPVGMAVRLFRQAFDGLGAAHQLGVLHRDIKPANLFVVDDEKTLKVTDFGIAKLANATSGHTETGAVVGTPAFIAPERLRGASAEGPAGDLYAMGIVMYRALTGVLPFRGRDVAQLFMQILTDMPVAPSSIDPDLSMSLDEVIMKLVAKEPEDRYASCIEAKAALDQAWEDMRRLNI